MRSIRARLDKAEEKGMPERVAFFTIQQGQASGRAWWRDDLKWQNLTKREYEFLKADLENEGVKVITVAVKRASPINTNKTAWDDV